MHLEQFELLSGSIAATLIRIYLVALAVAGHRRAFVKCLVVVVSAIVVSRSESRRLSRVQRAALVLFLGVARLLAQLGVAALRNTDVDQSTAAMLLSLHGVSHGLSEALPVHEFSLLDGARCLGVELLHLRPVRLLHESLYRIEFARAARRNTNVRHLLQTSNRIIKLNFRKIFTALP